MVVRKDFTVSAENLVWIGPEDLTELVPGTRFRTPHKFYETTLTVLNRGAMLAAANDDGFIILDDETFELREPLTQTASWLMVGYVKKEA